MNKAIKMLGFTVLCWEMAAALAQQPPAPAAPTATQSDAPAKDPAAPAAAKPAKATVLSEAGEPRANTSRAPAGRPADSGQKTPATDRLELGTATVTGDREQPKVMYIVPWKKSDIGDLAGKPMNSLVDEILAPVDRDVFKREVLYYRAVQAESAQNGAQKRASQGEK